MWASEQEVLDHFHQETCSDEDLEFFEQQQSEIDAENAYVRAEENRYVPGEFGPNGEGF